MIFVLLKSSTRRPLDRGTMASGVFVSFKCKTLLLSLKRFWWILWKKMRSVPCRELASNPKLYKIYICLCPNQKILWPTSIKHNSISAMKSELSYRRIVPDGSLNRHNHYGHQNREKLGPHYIYQRFSYLKSTSLLMHFS